MNTNIEEGQKTVLTKFLPKRDFVNTNRNEIVAWIKIQKKEKAEDHQEDELKTTEKESEMEGKGSQRKDMNREDRV